MANTQRATVWSLTINNPTGQDEEAIALARQKGWKVVGQKEVGAEGTEHYQLMLRTPQVRFSAVKKQFPRAHIEVARNPAALEQYVQKEDTRTGAIPTGQDRYPSFSKFIDLIYDYYAALGKDGFDYVALSDGHCVFYSEDNEDRWGNNPLLMLDRATRHLIKNGFYVEQIAGNPAVRSQWKLFWREMMLRSYMNKNILHIETQQNGDGETSEREDMESGTTGESSDNAPEEVQEVQIEQAYSISGQEDCEVSSEEGSRG